MQGIAVAASVTTTYLTLIDVERVVDEKLKHFKSQLDMELAPIRMAIASWEIIREAIPEIVSRMDRAQRQRDADQSEQLVRYQTQLEMHKENRGDQQRMMDLLQRHLGAHEGEIKAETRAADDIQRSHQKMQGWVKVGITGAAAGGGWLLKWLSDHAHKALHHK